MRKIMKIFTFSFYSFFFLKQLIYHLIRNYFIFIYRNHTRVSRAFIFFTTCEYNFEFIILKPNQSHAMLLCSYSFYVFFPISFLFYSIIRLLCWPPLPTFLYSTALYVCFMYFLTFVKI